ncbi:MAG: DUF3857 domain-containing protein [Arcicella sp.]|jgi:hypothetical protein|nr:DUF3857 domain-containing protein [Arcicella sp.]
MIFSFPFSKYALICGLLNFFCFSITAQDAPIKFGKIDMADLQMKVYEKDTAAAAIILCDYAESYHQYNTSLGLQIVYQRHRRIKILKKSGYEWATHAIFTTNAKSSSGKEFVGELKGATYNLVDGKIVTDKLTKESIFEEKVSDYRFQKKLSLPNVKEGSIIEYSYKITSDFDHEIREWEFQKSIPTVWSEYRVKIPDFYKFQIIGQGYESFAIAEVKDDIVILGAGVQSEPCKSYRWVMRDVPALKAEPFMTTIDDYRAKLEFEIAAYTPRNGLAKYYSLSWGDFSSTLSGYDSFGGQLRRGGFLKEVAKIIKDTKKDTLDRIQAAYDYVSNAMTWNGVESFYASSNLKKAHESKTGNAADINLMLIVLLRELDLEADPVVLSTRENGRVLDSYVLERKFNYVIAHTIVNSRSLLIDATEPFMKLGVLPVRCLNENGRLIHGNTGNWVKLSTDDKMSKTIIINMDITPEGQMKGNLNLSTMGYYAHDSRTHYRKEGKDKYVETFKKNHPTWEISKTTIQGEKELLSPFTVNFETAINENANATGDRIYFSPMAGEGETKNPFSAMERKFPVDFGTLIEESLVATYTLPKGYVVEEMPKPIKVSLPDDGGRFVYVVGTPEEGKLTVSSKVAFKKTTYFAEEYELLRKFYDQIVQKHAEQIVLKKK